MALRALESNLFVASLERIGYNFAVHGQPNALMFYIVLAD